MNKMKNVLKTFGILAIVLVSIVPFVSANEETTNDLTVIIVSDNMADSAVAESLVAQIESSIIIYVEWGKIDTEIINTVINLGASQVIIIGGPLAIVPELEEALAGIDIERVWGNNREETSLAVFNKFQHLYTACQQVAVANGGDEKAIAVALSFSLHAGCPIIFGNANGLNEKTKNNLKQSGIDQCILTAEEGVEYLESNAKNIISRTEEKLQNLVATITNDAPVPVQMLYANAVVMLVKANAAFEEDKFGTAFGLANTAYRLANNAISVFEKQNDSLYMQGNMAQKALEWLERVAEIKNGVYEDYLVLGQKMPQVELLFERVNDLISEAQTCYNQASYQCTLDTLVVVKEILREIESLISFKMPQRKALISSSFPLFKEGLR
ncbi:MAG: cell wall-binding repeat-containing protein [Candidatus Methanofastidiosia archaeon]